MEFDKYKNIGAYHWDEFDRQTIYRKHALKIVEWVDDNNIIDVGAGDGLITHLLLNKGINIVGIDDNEFATNIAKQKGLPIILGSAYSIPFEENYFEAVLLADIIEHFEFPDIALYEIARVLKTDGKLYITTPPKGKKLHDVYHYREYSSTELVDYLDENGFDIIDKPEIENVRIYAKFKKR